ncbi:hypothetical protein PQQ84_34035 [Paraburkholderia strydomiana]|uniref:hypothetical protein n=1 Tax=Paraburkholderia strydomiana TaxID=1245417 RepID=UPI0038BD541D
MDVAPAAATKHASDIRLTATGRESLSRTVKLRGSHETRPVHLVSRQQLSEEVVDLVLSVPGILMREVMTNAPDVSTLCRDVAAVLGAKTAPDTTSMDGSLMMPRSANNGQATAILRRKFETHFARRLSELLPG